MADLSGLGKSLLVLGAAVVLLGLVLLLVGKVGWLGRLPGDIHIEREGFSCYVPFASMLLVSLVLTLLANLVLRLLRR
jgi:hypothetical protein